MVVLSPDTFMDYIICPYRLSLHSTEGHLDPVYFTKIEVYSKLFDYCLYLRADRQSITISKLNRRLNFIWSGLDKDLIGQLSIKDKLVISRKLKQFIDLFSSINNVLYYELPREVSIGDNSILYNLFTYTQDYITKSVIKISRIHSFFSSSSSSLRLLGNIIRQDLKDLDSMNHQVYFLRLDTVSIYKPSIIGKKDLNMAVSSIDTGITQEVFFPKTDYLSCKFCPWKNKCQWNSINDSKQ